LSSPEQRSLRRWPAEGFGAGVALADAVFVEAKFPGVDLEEFFLRIPILCVSLLPFPRMRPDDLATANRLVRGEI